MVEDQAIACDGVGGPGVSDCFRPPIGRYISSHIHGRCRCMAFLLATLILAQALVIAMAAAVAGKAQKPAAGDKKKNNKLSLIHI